MTLNELLVEWSYRTEKGYPDMGNPSDILILKEILEKLELPTDILGEDEPEVTVSTNEPQEDPTPEEKLLYKGDFPYRKVVGALLWLQNVRPDISQTVRQLARHCLRYSFPHAEAAIHVLKYVYATRHMKIANSANRGQFLPIDSALRTTDLNQYLSSDYGGKVYKTVDNTYVDLDHYRVLRHAQPLSEGLARVDDDDKLIEIDKKFKIFKGGLTVIDIGAAPGSWSQYASKVVKNGKIISIDLNEMEPINNTSQIKGDFTDDETQQKIKKLLSVKSDVVMSDMAVNTTGIKNIDSIQTGELCKSAMIFSKDVILNSGFFISKIFMGGSFNEIVQLGKKIFKEVKVFKPKSSRKDSKESFIICKNLR